MVKQEFSRYDQALATVGNTVDTIQRYSNVAMLLHWLSALLVLGLLAAGFFMSGLGRDQIMLKFELVQWHKSFGILLFLLTLFRLGWRWRVKPPPLEAPAIFIRLAHLMHGALYLVLLAMPVVGWLMVSASPLGLPTKLFGIIPWPHLPFFEEGTNKEATEHLFHEIHETLAYILVGLLVLHVGAALYHQFVRKDGLIVRMIPAARGPEDKS